MKVLRPKFIVGIGGSAGALNAYTALLGVMPAKTNMAFVVISHMNPDASSQLAQILSRHTKMKVKVAANGMAIRVNYVYVIPPNADLLIEGYNFKVVSPRSSRNKAVDLFFISMADAMRENAIGVVLSGYDGDGTEGCKYIKSKGGMTFAQDMSAEINNMPLSALASGNIDFVLPPDKISKKLQELALRS